MATNNQILEQKISAAISMGFIPVEVKDSIKNNLNPTLKLRPYQIEALARFDYAVNTYPNRQKPTQLLFHMATGSGKTLIMAGIILDLYHRGYNNFVFFVNSSNIIEKTKDNFLNSLSAKYLFNQTISIQDKQINIKEVDNFEATNNDDINIVFTTIQGLHTRLNTPRENCLTYEDFADKKIVLLSDEAHHINATTKKGKKTKDELAKIASWEGTVNKIFQTNDDNLLLEFTATADLNHPEIKKKYQDKLLFDYPLKQFREDLYSKEVQVLQADLGQFERAMQAVILNQYRRKIFEKNKINIKPVILFKSKTIKDSELFFDEFISGIKNLKNTTINKIRDNATNQIIQKVFKYLDNNDIKNENFITEIQQDFTDDKCMVVNSKNDSIEKQLIVNSLEDENNEYRAIFAVDKLNEGWDVLNLFDIVRLYNTRDTDHKSGKVGKTTMSEAQLIGRGARYCPFKIEKTQPFYQRKYDKDIQNQLRVCEELYYHSAHNPKYISELNKALVNIGIKANNAVQRKLFLKDSFKQTDIFKNGVLWTNDRIKYDCADIYGLADHIKNKIYHKKFLTGYSYVKSAFDDNEEKTCNTRETKTYDIKSFAPNIARKALNRLPFYRFNNLQKYFPNLKSISEFLSSDSYAKNIQVEITGLTEQVQNPSNQLTLDTAISVFDEIAQAIPQDYYDYKGTKEFKAQSIQQIFATDKELNFNINQNSKQEYGTGQNDTKNQDLLLDLSQESWYVFNDNYGTSEEKYLVKYIKQAYQFLAKKYNQIYLIRNERHFKLYTFDEGQALEPDFVLILKKDKKSKSIIRQIFIEPKGTDRLSNDDSKTKERFLLQIEKEHKILTIFENKDYKLIGMPLFNQTQHKKEFVESFKKTIDLSANQ